MGFHFAAAAPEPSRAALPAARDNVDIIIATVLSNAWRRFASRRDAPGRRLGSRSVDQEWNDEAWGFSGMAAPASFTSGAFHSSAWPDLVFGVSWTLASQEKRWNCQWCGPTGWAGCTFLLR